MDDVWELDRVSNEEERSIIAYNILDALLSIKFDSESSWIPVSVRETSFS